MSTEVGSPLLAGQWVSGGMPESLLIQLRLTQRQPQYLLEAIEGLISGDRYHAHRRAHV